LTPFIWPCAHFMILYEDYRTTVDRYSAFIVATGPHIKQLM
jgi:hypothetical protein